MKEEKKEKLLEEYGVVLHPRMPLEEIIMFRSLDGKGLTLDGRRFEFNFRKRKSVGLQLYKKNNNAAITVTKDHITIKNFYIHGRSVFALPFVRLIELRAENRGRTYERRKRREYRDLLKREEDFKRWEKKYGKRT